MAKVSIRIDAVEGFFDRARKAAQKADRGEFFKTSITYSFEDVQELPKAASELRDLLVWKRRVAAQSNLLNYDKAWISLLKLNFFLSNLYVTITGV